MGLQSDPLVTAASASLPFKREVSTKTFLEEETIKFCFCFGVCVCISFVTGDSGVQASFFQQFIDSNLFRESNLDSELLAWRMSGLVRFFFRQRMHAPMVQSI